MADGPMAPGDPSPGADPLEPLDPDLTIFALANGMDLARERGGASCRALEWFREGLERVIRIEFDGGAASIWVGARRGRRSEPGEARRELRGRVPLPELKEGLRPIMNEALDAANALDETDLA
ncbi:MAG: hypothetical protein KY453_06035 [Gemmatimonadetes bacterium]|nr:hypothetical protein [Gemmatimonadota bacterium]